MKDYRENVRSLSWRSTWSVRRLSSALSSVFLFRFLWERRDRGRVSELPLMILGDKPHKCLNGSDSNHNFLYSESSSNKI